MAQPMHNYRFHCKKCPYTTLKRLTVEEFDKDQYSDSGHRCGGCGFPRMAVIRSNKMHKDGFVAGFQRSIRKHCDTYAEYKAHLKEMGLIELGYEDINPTTDNGETNYWDDYTLKKIHQMGVEITGNEAEALKNGLI